MSSAKPLICMLANGHTPFDTRIFLKESCTLVKAGFDVTIILPTHKNDSRDGVSILAVPAVEKGWQKLIINPWNIFKKAFTQPKDAVFHIHDSNIIIVGIALKLLGRKVIYDAHEDTPLQISYQHWLPAIIKRPYGWLYYFLEKVCGLLFDRIIVAEPVIAKYFPIHKTYLIHNFPIVDAFVSAKPKPYGDRDLNLVSVGTLSKVRGLFEMLEGAKLASQEVDFEFILGGIFAPAILEQQVVNNYKVKFLSWISFHALVSLLFNSRIGIIVPHPIERYKTNYPVKLFEFMAAGIPVIASHEGESAKFVTESQCGILVDPLNIKEIADAIIWLMRHTTEAGAMGKRGQTMIFHKYNWENESKVLLKVYEGMF